MLNINLKRQCYTYKHNAATDNIILFLHVYMYKHLLHVP